MNRKIVDKAGNLFKDKAMPKSVLVVDDERVNLELVKRALLSKGYEVETAADGEQALEALKKKPADLILLDVQMPNLDGYGFMIAKSKIPELAPIPVIVLTAMGQTEPLFQRRGVKAYLLKPINTQDLLDKVGAIAPV